MYVFLGQSPKAIEIIARVNKWGLIKCTRFCIAKETINNDNLQTINKKITYRIRENICKLCN